MKIKWSILAFGLGDVCVQIFFFLNEINIRRSVCMWQCQSLVLFKKDRSMLNLVFFLFLQTLFWTEFSADSIPINEDMKLKIRTVWQNCCLIWRVWRGETWGFIMCFVLVAPFYCYLFMTQMLLVRLNIADHMICRLR